MSDPEVGSRPLATRATAQNAAEMLKLIDIAGLWKIGGSRRSEFLDPPLVGIHT
jgi:hypothetical protein